MAEVHPIARARRSPCPICRKPSVPDHRPFCSARCRTLDLGKWLGGDYRVPTDEAPEDAEAPPPPRADEE